MYRTRIAAGLLLFLSACSLGCDTSKSSFKAQTISEPMLAQAWSVLKQAQDARLERLSTFTSSGQFTLRWFEGDNRRWEQLDARQWWNLPDQMAIRLSNLGSRLALAGWSGRNWWVFNEAGDEPSLSIFDMTSRGSGENQLLSPPLLFCLAGLVPFPTAMPVDLASSASGRFRFTIQSVNFMVDGRMVSMGLAARFELHSNGPHSVELIAPDGTTVARSALSKIKPVECRGQPQGAWPNLPFRIHMVMPSGTGKDSEATLSLDRPYAGGDVPGKMFDLDALKEAIKPSTIDDYRSMK